MRLKANIIANYLGQAWSSLMGILFLPLYIQLIGIEAYGLIGMIALVQIWLGLLDMGMGPMLNREMARFNTGAIGRQEIHNLLRSCELICLVLAAFTILLLSGLSGLIARYWIQSTTIPSSQVVLAIQSMSIVIGLRFSESLYRSALLGLQHQVTYNILNASLATLRYLGAWGALIWISPTLETFLGWQVLVSSLTVVTLAVILRRRLPPAPGRPRFSLVALHGVSAFAGGVMAISCLALLVTQLDKIILSRILSLSEFAYYSLAGTLANSLQLVTGPISQAIYPRLVELVATGNQAGLATTFHRASQLVAVTTSPAVALLLGFSADAIFVWSNDISLAERVGPILAVLALGTFLNCLLWIPSQAQLAHGWTRLTILSNIVAVSLLVPLLTYTTPRFGALGAGWAWVGLNVGYMIFFVHFMYRRILTTEKWKWYLEDIAGPVAGACLVVCLAWLGRPESFVYRGWWLVFLGFTWLLATLCSWLLAADLRRSSLSLLTRWHAGKRFSH
jgi:O-antigen/teichoic acid export membrane protein